MNQGTEHPEQPRTVPIRAAVNAAPFTGPKTQTEEPQGLSKLDDGRELGQFETRYRFRAWFCILVEGLYLLAVMVGLTVNFAFLSSPYATDITRIYGWWCETILGGYGTKSFQYFVIATAAMIGGALFSSKWLVHSVAKGAWNEDRRVWRFFVPITAAITALIFSVILQSGMIALSDPSPFRTLEVAAAFGALVGYFSDSVIGVLSNLANVLFGTVKDKKDER